MTAQRKTELKEKALRLFEQTKDVEVSCLKCDISRATFYRWLKAHKEQQHNGTTQKDPAA